MKAFYSQDKALKLNVGCGLNSARDYHNLDNSPSLLIQQNPVLRAMANIVERISGKKVYTKFPNDVRRCDVTRGLPYSAETVDVIYSSHMLEHLFYKQALAFLREAYRVLVPRGVLRLVLPDLERKARGYLAQTELARAGQLDEPPAEAFMRSTHLGVESQWGLLRPASLYRTVFARDGRHLWMWDAPSLIIVLRKIGFTEIHARGFRESCLQEISSLELEKRKGGSCFVEARK